MKKKNKLPICYDCQQEIPEKQQSPIWETIDGSLYIFFLCPACVKEFEDAGDLEEMEEGPSR